MTVCVMFGARAMAAFWRFPNVLNSFERCRIYSTSVADNTGVRNVWRVAMFSRLWQSRLPAWGVDHVRDRMSQNMRAKFNEIAPVSTKVVSGTNAVLFKTTAERSLVL